MINQHCQFEKMAALSESLIPAKSCKQQVSMFFSLFCLIKCVSSPCQGLYSDYLCLFLAISAFALAAMVLPGSYPHYLDLIHSLSFGPFLIGLAKFGIAFPVSYHTYNGIRHLVRMCCCRQKLVFFLILVS